MPFGALARWSVGRAGSGRKGLLKVNSGFDLHRKGYKLVGYFLVMSRSTASRDEGATFDELTAALKETLDRRGALRQIRASLRAEAFAALHNAAEQVEDQESYDASGRRPPLRPENAVINELIRDYLEFNGYLGAASVLEVEAGFAGNGGGDDDDRELSREMIKLELGVIENDDGMKSKKVRKKIPLLYGIIEALKRKNGQY